MKKSFLKLGGFIFLATLLSCSTDNESPQHTNNDEIGVNSTPNSKTTLAPNYIETAHQMANEIDYEDFVFENSYIQDFLSPYDLPMKEIITVDFTDELFEGMVYVDEHGIKSFFLSKGFDEYTADVMEDVRNNIDISDAMLSTEYASLPDIEQTLIQSAIQLQADLFAYTGATYSLMGGAVTNRRNEWMLLGMHTGAVIGVIGGGPVGMAAGTFIGGAVGYTVGIIADVTD